MMKHCGCCCEEDRIDNCPISPDWVDEDEVEELKIPEGKVNIQKIYGSEELKSYILTIRQWLINLAEDRSLPMDVRVHESIWHQIRAIDRDLATDFKEV